MAYNLLQRSHVINREIRPVVNFLRKVTFRHGASPSVSSFQVQSVRTKSDNNKDINSLFQPIPFKKQESNADDINIGEELSGEVKKDLSGCVSERMQQDLVWNRTVNLRGGAGNNDEVDLVSEFLNKEFKEPCADNTFVFERLSNVYFTNGIFTYYDTKNKAADEPNACETGQQKVDNGSFSDKENRVSDKENTTPKKLRDSWNESQNLTFPWVAK